VKLSEMPNFLKLIWSGRIARSCREVVVWQVTPVGIGNSPPEMKVADSPEIAVRFGSASVRHHARALHRAQRRGDTDAGVHAPNEVVKGELAVDERSRCWR
jgi:hypothetical protein